MPYDAVIPHPIILLNYRNCLFNTFSMMVTEWIIAFKASIIQELIFNLKVAKQGIEKWLSGSEHSMLF